MARTGFLRSATQIGALAVGLCCLGAPAKAVTCDEVRSLSAHDIAYWAKRLNVSPEHLALLMSESFCSGQRAPEQVVASKEKPIDTLR